ncbi:MAG: HsdR family type I site-specific deoxyribonuclease [Clostridia bacterium]|nr:HsdR family type I site-specific deoxyribonuclease [Clostridia bacterium]
MFTEEAIEKMIIDTLVSQGWEYIPAEHLPRNYSDVMVEPMVRDALIRLNPEIAANPSFADEVIIKLRPLFMQAKSSDLVTINEEFKSQIFDKNSFPFGKNHSFVPVRYFGMGSPEEMAKNRYVVTNQWVYPQVEGGKRLDIVLLINGFPVVIGEIKTATREAISWVDGAEDILAYEKSIPGMFVSNIFNFATEGKRFRYGSINAGVTHWGPWHVPEIKTEGTLADVQRSVSAMIRHETVLDIFRYFTIFSTDKKNRKIKIVCRYQQYEGANAIVERVKTGKPKKGLIWHFQGSGKSYLMVFAAQKLRMTSELNNATIIVVLDRVDLEKQIHATFSQSKVPNIEIAESKADLKEKLVGDVRKIIITTIFLFDQIDGMLNPRDNIILMVDEAHRTQEGNLGANMRKALPNAFFFGLTGTPINHLDHNTFATFGATEDAAGYMSKYSFSDSIRDGATLSLNFETVPLELRVDQETIDEEFDRLTEDITEEQKSNLARRVRTEALIKAPDRIEKVCQHIYDHYRSKVEPNGFKGMVVCYDRESCVLYKEQLDKLFDSPYYTEIVMDTNNDKENRYIAYRRSPDEEQRLLDKFRDPRVPLKLLIVTSKLLTGFDAPILQVMYLDKPMKDHTLLQAICRTNRVYGEKSNGLIVDYIGIFDKFARALNFDEESMRNVIKNIDGVKEKVPELIEKCLKYFCGVDRTDSSWEGLAAAQQCLPNDEMRDKFGADYRVLHRIWNIVSPDPCLTPYKFDYKWLSLVYESVRPSDDTGHLIWSTLGPKTIELVQENITAIGIHGDVDVLEADADLIEQFINDKERSEKAAKKIEINLDAIIKGRIDDPVFVSLGERLEQLRKLHEQGLLNGVEFLKKLLDLAKDTAAAVRKAQSEAPVLSQEEKGKAALTELFKSVKNRSTPIIVERIVNEIDEIVKIVRFPGWQDTDQGRKDVEKALRTVFIKKRMLDNELFEKAYGYVEQYY